MRSNRRRESLCAISSLRITPSADSRRGSKRTAWAMASAEPMKSSGCIELNGTKLGVAPGIVLWPDALVAPSAEGAGGGDFRSRPARPIPSPHHAGIGQTVQRGANQFRPPRLGVGRTRLSLRNGPSHDRNALARRFPDPCCRCGTPATGYAAPPECCLVNLYRGGARMGLHQDQDEAAVMRRCCRCRWGMRLCSASAGRPGGGRPAA